MKRTTIALALLAGSFFLHSASAQTAPVKFLINGAFEFGGDKVAEIYFTDGSTQSVRAGQGGTIGAGIQVALIPSQKLLLRGSVGYKYVTTKADNEHIRLTRVPLMLTANYMVAPKFRLAAGVVSHRAIRFNPGSIGPKMNFNPATGPIFEFAYSGIGLSYVPMKYKDEMGNAYSANAIGITFSITLPQQK